MRKHLPKNVVKTIIERKSNENVPLLFHKWWGNGLYEKYGQKLDLIDEKYPDDFHISFYQDPGEDVSPNHNPDYRWGYRDNYVGAETHSIGHQKVLLPEWDEFQDMIDHFPNPNEPGNFDVVKNSLDQAGDRYKLGCWWRFLHERFWGIRGMENLMLDYYDEFDKLFDLGQHLINYYKGIVDQFAALGYDGIFVSDDLGHQSGPMMSPQIFEKLYFPLYQEFADYVHSKKMDFFLHTCGDNTKLMPFLIQAGVDVIHPIQKGCMDYRSTAESFGNKITFMVGVDVQHLLPNGSPDEINNEIDIIIDIFNKPGQGLLLAAGNGILSDTPIENIDAMLQRMTIGPSADGTRTL